MERFRWLGIYAVMFLLLLACTNSEGSNMLIPTHSQGVIMKAFPIGRFSIGVPIGMQQAGRSHRLRLVEITEIQWPQGSNSHEVRNKEWSARLSEIQATRPPYGKTSPVIEEREVSGIGRWARGVFYFENYALEDEGDWEVLVDFGPCGLWFRSDSTLIENDNGGKMLRNVMNIARSYTARAEGDLGTSGAGDWFHLQNGAINLPYRWQEKSYARFKDDHLDAKLEIEMHETHVDEPKDEGLLARTAAIIATGYATGVDIKRLRSKKRKVAGLEGEEEVDRMRDKYRTAISFGWRYAGKKDSGEYPEIVIRMESPDGNLEEKLKVWDAILDSMKPLYKQL